MCVSKWFCFCHARFIIYCDFFRTDFFRTKYIEYFRILKINLILIPFYVNSYNFHNTHHFPSALCLQPIALIYQVIGARLKAEGSDHQYFG